MIEGNQRTQSEQWIKCWEARSNLNFGQEINASSFVFEATGLLPFHPEVLHVGENHILHCLAKSSRKKKKNHFLHTLHALKGSKDDIYFTTSPLLWVVMPTCNIHSQLKRNYVKYRFTCASGDAQDILYLGENEFGAGTFPV